MMPRNLFAHVMLAFVSAFAAIFFLSGCDRLKPSVPTANTVPSPSAASELRWSNGRRLKTIDPVLAAAPPETDLVRALFDGLTEIDSRTQRAVPAIAEKWESSHDWRTWRFYLRENAVWTNGRPVTANDFVRSWNRYAEIAERAAFPELLLNLGKAGISPLQRQDEGQISNRGPEKEKNTAALTKAESASAKGSAANTVTTSGKREKLNVLAESDRVLRVELSYPDRDFPVLAAHPAFRPVYETNLEFEPTEQAVGKLVTNGAFCIERLTETGVSLVPFEHYWDRDSVKLDRVQMIFSEPEKALNAYRSGELDAVSNLDLSPAAVKIFEPYDDFRRVTHAAVNLYEINTSKAPFTDRRVRMALATAIERERLVDGEMQGTVRPAFDVLPFRSRVELQISQDVAVAKSLLSEAGFSDGVGFPAIILVVNRNDLQLRIARAVARMWKQNLGIDTEIAVRDGPEIDGIRRSGDYDLVRRGVVFAAPDETAALITLFSDRLQKHESKQTEPVRPITDATERTRNMLGRRAAVESPTPTEFTELIYEMRFIPLYFPTAVSLVKPYVKGMEPNAFDIVILKNVEINKSLQQK